MGFSCMKCKKFMISITFWMTKKTQPITFSDFTKMGVCQECFEKREKWMKSRGIK